MTEPRWLDDVERRAWQGLVAMSQLLEEHVNQGLRRAGELSMADYRILVPLSEAEGHRLRMQELAAQARWEKSRLSHQVRRMEGRGLVRRENCPTDARGAFAVLTPEGLDAIRAVAPLHAANVRRIFVDALSRDQLESLAEISETVVHGLGGSTGAE
ncbi:MarR family winged helix-turn-helix transcriptional regulator [Streptomyces sp. NPDC057445]|uniref:MarR family winged helix-turn-helix transcriptional regulator n=1 Tax=Streptomyces sp. NPDC057445 TaxID=3346136 RepID=UPI00367A4BF6